MNKEKIVAILLVLLVSVICFYMVSHWSEVKERTLLRGVFPAEPSGF